MHLRAIPLSLALAAGALADPGDVLWSFSRPMNLGSNIKVTPEGHILWSGRDATLGGYGGVTLLRPDGSVVWFREDTGNNGMVDVLPDGRVVVGDITNNNEPSVGVLSRETGETIWEREIPDGSFYNMLRGPNVGPDGNIYFILDVPFGVGDAFSYTPDGQWRWQVHGFDGEGARAAPFHFVGDVAVAVEDNTPMPPNRFGLTNGIVALNLEDGALDWYHQMNLGPSAAQRQGAVSPTTGNFHLTSGPVVRAYAPTGDLEWETRIGQFFSISYPTVGPEGNVYALHTYTDARAVNDAGDIIWQVENIDSGGLGNFLTPSPDGEHVAYIGSSYNSGFEEYFFEPGEVFMFAAADGEFLWHIDLPVVDEGVAHAYDVAFSPDGGVMYVACSIRQRSGHTVPVGYIFAIEIAAGDTCEADLNGDGQVNGADFLTFLQLYFAADERVDFTGDDNNRVQFHMNNGDGTFVMGNSFQVNNGSGLDKIVALDFDRDGNTDLAVTLGNSNAVAVFRNTGSGAFVEAQRIGTGAEPESLRAYDLDGDGDTDLLVANRDGNSFTVLTNNNGTFAGQTVQAGAEPRDAAAGDFNGDGLLDVVVTNHDDRTIGIYTNNGNSFTGPVTLGVGNNVRPEGVDVADYTGDGRADIAVSVSDTPNAIALFINNNGQFNGFTYYNTGGQEPGRLASADFDSDGDIDIAVANEDSGNIAVLENTGGAFTGPMLIATGANPDFVTIAGLDDNASPDIVVTNRDSNNISVLINNDQGGGDCEADLNGDGQLNGADFLTFLQLYFAGDERVDFDKNGQINGNDFLMFLQLYFAGC